MKAVIVDITAFLFYIVNIFGGGFMTVTFSFELNTDYMTHIKEVSYYNHNYYKLDLNRYGDYILPASCDVLYEEFDEYSETYTYTLGYFINDEPRKGEFEHCFTWTEMECKTIDYNSFSIS